MANSNTATDNVLSVSTLAKLHPEHAATIPTMLGPINPPAPSTEVATLFNVNVPVSYVDVHGDTINMFAQLTDYENFVARNWNATGSKSNPSPFSGKTDAEKAKLASDPKAAGYEPSDTDTLSTQELAALNVIVSIYPEEYAGMSVSKIAKDAKMQRAIVKLLNSPEYTEKYHDRYLAEVKKIDARQSKRSRKGKAKEASDAEDLSL